MELDRNQPSGNGLREALAPWFDHSAAWLVLLCIGLTIFADGHRLSPSAASNDNALVDALHRHCRHARRHFRRLARIRRCPSCAPSVAGAWRWLAFALVAQLVATLAVPVRAPFEAFLPCRRSPDLLQFAFFPCAALAATGLLRSTRGKAFGPQFWLEATLVALCVGTVLWLALPHDLADDALPVARRLDRRPRRRDRRARRDPAAASRRLAGLAGTRRPSPSRSAPWSARTCWKRMRRQPARCRLYAGPLQLFVDRGLCRRRAFRLPAQRPARTADGCLGARFAVRLAHAVCRPDARRLCTPRAAQGQFRRARRAHRLGRLHRRGPAVRAPGDRDGALGRGPDRPRDALCRGALQRADPEHRRRDRDRRRRTAPSAT